MPNTYLFNPDNDLALANGDVNYLSPRSAHQMICDLCSIPVWYASDGDSILIPDSTTLYYREQEPVYKLLCPNVKWITTRETIPQQNIRPWGWNPALIKQLSLRGISPEYLPDTETMSCLKQLSSRLLAVEIMQKLSTELSTEYPIIGKSVACYNEQEISNQVKSLPNSILKAPWSSSGKGLRKGTGSYGPPLSGWCTNTLSKQGCVIVEPFYNRIEDFAIEFYSQGNGTPLHFIGYSYFQTDDNGAYKSNRLLSDNAIELLLSQYISIQTLHKVRTSLNELLTQCISPVYKGYLGVDMMICSSTENTNLQHYCLHPCVEINLRMNMGIVAHHLYEHYVSADSEGIFTIEYQNKNDELQKLHLQRRQNNPLTLTSDRYIRNGYLNLTPVNHNTNYCAWLLIKEMKT